MTIYEVIEDSAREFPRRTAYSYFSKHCTYEEFKRDIDSTASGLLSMGIKSGDRVAVTAMNSPETITGIYALNKIGAVAVMLNPKSPAKELTGQLRLTKAKAIIYSSLVENSVNEAIQESDVTLAIRINSLKGLSIKFLVGSLWKNLWSGEKRVPFPERVKRISFHKLTGEMSDYVNRDEMTDAMIFFGGGSSGRLRAVVHSSQSVDLSAENCLRTERELDGSESMLAMLPAFHMFGFVVVIHIAFRGGIRCVMIPIFEKKHCARMLLKGNVTFTAGVPVLFQKILSTGIIQKAVKSGKKPFKSFRHGFCGGDVMDSVLRESFNDLLIRGGAQGRIDSGYGMTECCPISLARGEKYSSNNLGKSFPGIEIGIFLPETDIRAQEGEICVKSEQTLKYSFDVNGICPDTLIEHSDGSVWLHTGDMGRIGDDGNLEFMYRLKRLFKVSGNTALAMDIEAVCDAKPGVVKSYAVAIPDKLKQNAVKLYVSIEENIPLSDEIKEEINELYKKSMAPWSRPVEIILCRDNQIPRTPMGKTAWGKLESGELHTH